MSDEPFYSPDRTPKPARQPKPGERLFAFTKGRDEFVCELRDHSPYGAEAQFLLNGQLYRAHVGERGPVAVVGHDMDLIITRAGAPDRR
jgi:hypothetical protein